MSEPYEPVAVSQSEEYPRTNTPVDGEAVGVEYHNDALNRTQFTLEDSRNWYSWIEATGHESFVDLDDWR